MKIEIKVDSPSEIYYIKYDTENSVFKCNGKDVKYEMFSFKEKLFDIIVYWDDDMTIPDITDAEAYSVKIEIAGEKRTFTGKGLYPDNYFKFKELLKEVANG